jgi:hypothetical protein
MSHVHVVKFTSPAYYFELAFAIQRILGRITTDTLADEDAPIMLDLSSRSARPARNLSFRIAHGKPSGWDRGQTFDQISGRSPPRQEADGSDLPGLRVSPVIVGGPIRWELARQCGIAVDDEYGDLLPGVLDATSRTVSQAIWFGLTTGYLTLTGSYYIPRKFLTNYPD